MNDYNKYLAISTEEEDWGFYVTTVGYTKTSPNQEYPQNRAHPASHSFTWNKGRVLNEYYIVFISKGNGVFESSKTEIENVREGTCFFLFPGVWHRYKPDKSSGWEEYWLGFNGSYPEQLINKGFFKPENPFVHSNMNEVLLGLFQKLLDTVRSSKFSYQKIISGITLQILGLLNVISTHNEHENNPQASMVAKAKFLLQESLEKVINIEDLAKELMIGYSKFRTVFKQVTGESPNQYYLNIRLKKAKELLDSTNMNINEVAFQTGFNSIFYFSKLFKKKNGISPKHYRNGGVKALPTNCTKGL